MDGDDLFVTDVSVDMDRGCSPELHRSDVEDVGRHVSGKAQISWRVEFCPRSYGFAFIRPVIAADSIVVRYDEEDFQDGTGGGPREVRVDVASFKYEYDAFDGGSEPGLLPLSVEIDSERKATVRFQTSSC